MTYKKIAVIVGSLRRESFNRKMAKTLMALAPESLKLEIVEIDGLSLYNQDLDDDPPAAWTEFRDRLFKYDGFLFLTPEYNRSFSGVLKNAIDIGSRPYGKSVWGGKPAGVVSVSVSPLGGFGANHHLRQVLTVLNVPVMAQPEAYIPNAAGIFDGNGELVNEQTKKVAADFMSAFAKWVEALA